MIQYKDTMLRSWLRWLVTGFSPRRYGFSPRSVHVRFLVDKLTLGEVFSELLGFHLSVSTVAFHTRISSEG